MFLKTSHHYTDKIKDSFVKFRKALVASENFEEVADVSDAVLAYRNSIHCFGVKAITKCVFILSTNSKLGELFANRFHCLPSGHAIKGVVL